MKRRRQQLLLLAACSAIGPLALNVHLPALPLLQREFNADVAAVQASVSLALLGFGLGLLFLGPLSDRYGRRTGLLAGLATYVLGSLIAFSAQSLLWVNVGRFVLAAGAALTFISARTVVADRTARESLPRSIAQVTMINVLAQSMAPLMGNGLIALGGWRLTQGAGVVAGIIVAIVVYLRQPETLSRAAMRRARASTADPTAPLRHLVAQGSFRRLMLQVGMLYSTYPALVATAPHLMVAAFHRPASEFAWYFACLPLGYLLGNFYVVRRGAQRDHRSLVRQGTLIAALGCATSIALLALGAWHPLSLFIPAGLVLNFGLGLALPAISTRAVLGAGAHVGSAWALVGFSQQLVAALAVQFLGLVHSDSPWPVLCLSLGVVLLVALLDSSRMKGARNPGE